MHVPDENRPSTPPARKGWLGMCTSIVDRLFGLDLRPEEKTLLAQRSGWLRRRPRRVLPAAREVHR